METVRICFTSPSLNAYSETFIQNLKLGLEGEIFHCHGDFFPFMSLTGSMRNYRTAPLLDILKLRVGLISVPLREHYFAQYLKTNQINLIFANYGPSGAALAPLAAKMRIPLVVHFHGFDASIASLLEKYRLSYLVMFKIASRIIVVSEEMKRDLVALGAPVDKLVKITYAPHERFLNLKPKFLNSQLLTIGRFVEKKAPYLTLMAYKLAKEKCPGLSLKMVGDGDLLFVCKDLCRSLRIPDVEFMGVQGPAEIADLMEYSFCFVQHSKQSMNGDKEGTPVAILEAMAAGLPIVSTRHAGIPDVVSDGLTGFLVEEGDVAEMANRIVELFFDRDKAHEFGVRGRERIQKDFRQEDYFQQINEAVIAARAYG